MSAQRRAVEYTKPALGEMAARREVMNRNSAEVCTLVRAQSSIGRLDTTCWLYRIVHEVARKLPETRTQLQTVQT